MALTSIDYSRIPQKKVRKLVRQQSKDGVILFNELKSACYTGQDTFIYSYHESNHTIKGKIQNVWSRLKQLKPDDEFRGKIISFGFLYSNKLNRVFYSDDDYSSIEEGEIVYLNLKLLGGIKRIAVALEVTKVDDEDKIIQFCYLENGMSVGTQQIRLIESNDGETIISHETRYRNDSKFREKYLYPIFHQKAVSELHLNLCKLVEKSTTSASVNF